MASFDFASSAADPYSSAAASYLADFAGAFAVKPGSADWDPSSAVGTDSDPDWA